jgi:DsbC/DsbD-like thiol-disulfide interchange protein/cytochrome c biogenesis protein CcdA
MKMTSALAVRTLALAAAVFFHGGQATAAADPAPDHERHTQVELISEARAPAAGSQTALAIAMTPDPGWHGYWKVPGDAGFATTIEWSLPPGVTVSEPSYPVPKTLLISGLMNHVYEGPYALIATLSLPAGLERGTRLPISVRLKYLVCTTSICVPEGAEVSRELVVGDGQVDAASLARFDAWRQALPRPVASLAHFEVANGRIRVGFPLPAAVKVGSAHLFAATPGAVEYAAPQTFSRRGDTLVIETAAGSTAPQAFDGVLALGDGTGLSFSAAPGAVPPAGEAIRSGTMAVATIALLGAILGGLILNVMPCVFPILSLKAFSLVRAGGDERGARREAVAYTGGVILVCVGLGALILALRAAGSEIGWAFQLQNPMVVLMLILLTSAIGFNLAGLFELGTLSAGSGLVAKGGTAGAFWTGALAAFVATPCAGPFMAGALGAALLLPTIAALSVFAGLGLGLSLPFLALGFVPAFRRILPKPGAWMETFRRILSVPMFLTALGLVWVLGRQTDVNGAVTGLGAAMLMSIGLWATGLRQRGSKRTAWWPAAAALVMALGCIWMLPKAYSRADTGYAAAQRFDADRLVSLRAAGKPVFLYFTADWCLTCKVNERAAIERRETQEAFSRAGVVTLVGDWTDGNPDIGRFIASQGRSGVPLYLWYAPGGDGQTLPQILTPHLLVSLAMGNGN